MYLRSATISNIKQIRDLTLDFRQTDGAGPRRLTVLLGRNGTGKTTILRAIAMALGGASAANQLVNPLELAPLSGQDRGASHAQAPCGPSVSVEVSPPESLPEIPNAWSIHLPAGELFFKGDAAADQLDRLRAASRPGLFVAGYGVNRALPSPMTPFSLSVPIYGQLGSLFDSLEHGRLIATNFVDMLEDPRSFVRVVQRILKRADLLPGLKEVELRGKGGVSSTTSLVETRRFELNLAGRRQKVPATWLSHGYQSTIAWVVDLLGRIVLGELGGKVHKPEDVSGVLLIDEIDIHLHPAWQRSILKGLADAFPRLQIIATTHSPMVVADLRPDEIYLLDNDPEQGVTAKHPELPPRMLTAAQLLSEYFGVQRTSAGELHAALDELRRLTDDEGQVSSPARKRSAKVQREVDRLRHQLADAGLDVDAWLEDRR